MLKLSDPKWQGIGVIIAILAILISIFVVDIRNLLLGFIELLGSQVELPLIIAFLGFVSIFANIYYLLKMRFLNSGRKFSSSWDDQTVYEDIHKTLKLSYTLNPISGLPEIKSYVCSQCNGIISQEIENRYDSSLTVYCENGHKIGIYGGRGITNIPPVEEIIASFKNKYQQDRLSNDAKAKSQTLE